jgi:RNA polymerase sigma factor (TIGR02999 family)
MPGKVTKLLQKADSDRSAEAELFALLEPELRNIALGEMKKGLRPGADMNTRILVEEAFLRLVHNADTTWEDRAKFFGYAARKIHDILVETLRATQNKSRPPANARVEGDFDAIERGDKCADDLSLLLDLRSGLAQLQIESWEAATIFRLRHLWSFSFTDLADVFGIPVSTVRDKWVYARAYLARYLEGYHGSSK